MLNLTPPAIQLEDREIAQAAVFGGERKVSLTADACLLLGIAFIKDGSQGVEWEFINKPNGSGPVVCFVMGECKAADSVDVSYGGATGNFHPVSWAENQSFNFAAGRGVELSATPSVADGTTLPSFTNVKRGAKFAFVQLPALANFVRIGATTAADITVPSKTGKNVSSGLESSRWSKPGKTAEGKLKINGKDYGGDDGLNRFRGMRCVAMIETRADDVLITSRQFATNYVPGAVQTNGDADAESMNDCEGTYQFLVSLVAPGADESDS